MPGIPFMLFMALVLSTGPRADEAPIGFVKTVTGDASVTTAGHRIKAEVGTAVHQGSLLRTGANGGMGVTFIDETLMSFGPDTQVTVDEYVYAPARGKLRLATDLARGSINYVSGIIAKLRPDAVTVDTPSGTIGVRGTQFVVRVE